MSRIAGPSERCISSFIVLARHVGVIPLGGGKAGLDRPRACSRRRGCSRASSVPSHRCTRRSPGRPAKPFARQRPPVGKSFARLSGNPAIRPAAAAIAPAPSSDAVERGAVVVRVPRHARARSSRRARGPRDCRAHGGSRARCPAHMPGLEILPLIEAGKLVLAGHDFEAEAERVVDQRHRHLARRRRPPSRAARPARGSLLRRRQRAVADALLAVGSPAWPAQTTSLIGAR